ncbi:MAG: hypothetical protein HXY25_01065 [Alphaproteobacteria bacterium]|nr:hypothetical protein [Alphaproteobacteria bacterium]
MALALALGLGLAGCVSTDTAQYEGDPAFSIGYGDGCQTGNARVRGFKETVDRDGKLWDESEAYRAGWRKGYNACGQGRSGEKRDDFLQDDRYDQGAI